jgi:prohibitin 2
MSKYELVLGMFLMIGGIIGTFLFLSIAIVPAGHRGVVLTWGAVSDEVFNEGFHTIMPIAQQVKIIEVRTQKYEAVSDSASKDLQSVSTTVALNFRLDAEKVNAIYQTLGLEYQDRIIVPAIEESVKSSTAKFTAEELITKRPEVKEDMFITLKERLLVYGLIVESVNIMNFQFSPEFDKAIELKVMAEQESLTAERLLEKVKFEAQQMIEQAKGEAEAIRIIALQLEQNPAYLTLKALEIWDGRLPMVTGEGGIPFIPIDINE